jgi:hypothetical protein
MEHNMSLAGLAGSGYIGLLSFAVALSTRPGLLERTMERAPTMKSFHLPASQCNRYHSHMPLAAQMIVCDN